MYTEFEFQSQTLHYPIRIRMVLPTDRRKSFDEKFPVLYLFHGADHAAWVHNTAVERYAEQTGIAVVMPDNANTAWRTARVELPDVPYMRGRTEDYEAFLATELPSVLAKYFPISTAREDSYIAGLSLGGYGAAYHAFTRPQDYAAVGIFSGALFDTGMFAVDRTKMTKEELKAKLFPDLVQPIYDIAANGGDFPKVFMMNGTKDVQEFSPLYAEILRENGAEVYTDFTSHAFGHEWPFWDICIRTFLPWIVEQRKQA